MRTIICTHTARAALAFALAAATLPGASPATAQEGCAGFDRQHTITRLGGRNALSPGGLETLAELQAYVAAHPEEIRSILAGRGLGADVADALLAAIRDGAGVSERATAKGERLEWMAYRRGAEIRTIEDVCLDLTDALPAFEITVPIVTATTIATADCTLEATTDCRPDGAGTLTVRAAPGARITLEGPGGARTLVDGGEPTWSGPMDTPSHADHTLSVTNTAMTTETVRSYTFLVPRECVNLSLVGESEQQRPGTAVRCDERRVVSCPVPPPPPPSCVVELDRTEVRRGDAVTYRVTGRWATIDLELQRDSELLSQPELRAEGGTLVLTRRGAYTIVGRASDGLGTTVPCPASFEVVGTDWIVRPFGALVMVDDQTTGGVVGAPAGAKACPCFPDASYGLDDGYGLGVSLERRLGERFGLEARALYGRLDDRLWIGANGLGITDEDTVDYWDLSLGLNLHLTPGRVVDWYAGPFVGYSDLEGHTSHAYARSLELEPEGDVTWGVQTGLDWALGAGPWSLHLGARYTWYDMDVTRRYIDPTGSTSEQTGSLDLDPVTAELGVAYRF